ncbi:aspartate aminotransferase family protein [Steroidobacter sp.]|uniref:aspartate aminotransferase family protein n=1 Tax=Steroidobacter sp. TaxID=1978227 RepID=UPI001A5582E3|nr:aminotransferase class III-fold pyridoxal phosphate-dependent enzyme [Steroidobacter sp.]MBL8267776.1 aminotransferase class III-fold pyridoxal phosphate-dependent enzyme [Steroidobacter sp.]
MSNTSSDITSLLARRRRLLGPTYGHFYAEPLHFVRAEGVWMYDAEGRAYLDVYNNVPVVGHCHPHVVEALSRQARTLNTHTRYLTDQPLELAERLLATMPDEIGHMIFTCTGSEANDLAIRIAKATTGGTGVIVSEFAYHGITETLAGMSPSSGTGQLGPGVFAVPAPISQASAADFPAAIQRCLERMQAANIKPAALLADTIFSSDGVASHAPGFLADAAKHVRAAGGLVIADEVQPGFARTGQHMWGFQRHGLVPDLITMGKPMGNGHPIAALAARPELLEQFGARTRYFNTFGGNTVSCAVALAVLDVIERQGLMRNAHDIGNYLLAGLARLAAQHPCLGEVRGAGLFIGLPVLATSAGADDSRQRAARIVNALKQRGALIGLAGPKADVLKIRPPLTFGRAEADLLLERLDQAIRDSST